MGKKQNNIMNRKWALFLEYGFLVFIFLFYFIWALNSPFNSAPDESMRFDIPKYIFDFGKLPVGHAPEIREEFWGISYAFNPILSYMISAFFMKITSVFTHNGFAMLMAARMTSILFGTATVWTAMKISKKLLPKIYRPPFVCLVALLPQNAYLATYVNNDSMAVFSTALIIYMWILGIERDWDLKTCIGLGAGVSVCALSYYNAYGFILCSILLFAFTAAFCGKKQPDCLTMIKKGLLISGIVFLLAGWWFIRNAVLYQGDFLGMRASSYYAELYAQEAFKPSNRITMARAGKSIYQMLFTEGWLHNTQNSFVGRFGFAKTDLPGPMYYIYLPLMKLAVFGLLLRFSSLFSPKERGKWNKKNILHIVLAISAIIPPLLSIYYSYYSDFQPQGRYVMPMLIPAMYFTVLGVSGLLSPFIRQKNMKRLSYGYSILLVFSAVYSYARVFYPMFH